MVKAIAVDMDGTFLNSDNDYNRERFEKLFTEMMNRNIKFIVASGNQYAQLRSFFPKYENEMTFVSENGALIFEKNKLIQKTTFNLATVRTVLQLLQTLPFPIGIVLSGVSQAYMLKSEPEKFKSFARIYYHRLTELETFSDLPQDDFVKFALQVPGEQTEELVERMNRDLKGKVTAVSSGHGYIDLIIPGTHKGRALQFLLENWEITPSELVSFGDGNNDLEMLTLAGKSYAMKNGSNETHQTAQQLAPTNDEDGVLAVIESLLEIQ